jgi:hypothetical protein
MTSKSLRTSVLDWFLRNSTILYPLGGVSLFMSLHDVIRRHAPNMGYWARWWHVCVVDSHWAGLYGRPQSNIFVEIHIKNCHFELTIVASRARTPSPARTVQIPDKLFCKITGVKKINRKYVFPWSPARTHQILVPTFFFQKNSWNNRCLFYSIFKKKDE